MLPITQALITEHAVFTTVFNKIEHQLSSVRTVEEVKLLGSLVEALLEDHATAETDLAFAALDHALDQEGQLEKMHQDHHEIDSDLRAVQTAATLSDARHLLKLALHATRKHFKREELNVFPVLEKMLNAEALTQLGSGWMAQHQAQA